MNEKIKEKFRQIAEEMFEGNQSEMARAMHMLPQSLHPYMKGDREPGYTMIKRLVEIGVNPLYLFSDNTPMRLSFASNRVKEDIESYSDINDQKTRKDAITAHTADLLDHLEQLPFPGDLKIRLIRTLIRIAEEDFRLLREDETKADPSEHHNS